MYCLDIQNNIVYYEIKLQKFLTIIIKYELENINFDGKDFKTR